MIIAPGSADIFFGAAQKTMTGTALPASNSAGTVFSMILAGMKGGPSGTGPKAGQMPSFNSGKSGRSLSLGNSLGNRANGEMSGKSSVAAKLESKFQTRGISLEKIVLEQGDFEFLGAVLEKMGFSQSRIQQFFNQMMETRSDGSITLADFFKDLIAFEQDEKFGHGIPGSSLSVSLDKSAIPHLELILRDLGVSAEKTNDMLANAARENGALDMNKLIFQLKQYAAALEKNAALKSNQTSGNLSTGKQTDLNQTLVPSARNMADGLSKLGISVSNSDADTPFSLKAFIAALEQKHQGSAQAIKPAALNTGALTDNQNEMPALRSMEMQKINTFFGFAREMMSGSKHDAADNLSENNVAGLQYHEKQKNTRQSLSRSASFLNTPDTDSSRASSGVQQPVDHLAKEMEKGIKSLNDTAARPGSVHDGIAGMERFQTANSQSAQMDGSAGINRNAGTWQNTPVPQSVVNQVGKEIAAFLQRGDRFLTLQLKPPELGMVNIEMDVKENLLKMSIVTETGSAKDMLQANYADLRRVLEGYGVKVEAFDIQLSSSLNQSATNGDSSLNQHNHHSGRFGKHVNSKGHSDENDSEPPPAPQHSRDGLVDLLA